MSFRAAKHQHGACWAGGGQLAPLAAVLFCMIMHSLCSLRADKSSFRTDTDACSRIKSSLRRWSLVIYSLATCRLPLQPLPHGKQIRESVKKTFHFISEKKTQENHISAEIQHLGSSQVLNIQFPVVVLPEPIAQSTGPGRKENSEEIASFSFSAAFALLVSWCCCSVSLKSFCFQNVICKHHTNSSQILRSLSLHSLSRLPVLYLAKCALSQVRLAAPTL